jgi:hypothetical protein
MGSQVHEDQPRRQLPWAAQIDPLLCDPGTYASPWPEGRHSNTLSISEHGLELRNDVLMAEVLLLGSLQWPHQTTGNGGAPCIRFGHSNRPLSCSGIIPCILLSHVVVGCYPITGSAPPASVPSYQVIHHTAEALAIYQAISKKQSIVLHQCRVSGRQSSIIRKPYQLFRLQPTLIRHS